MTQREDHTNTLREGKPLSTSHVHLLVGMRVLTCSNVLWIVEYGGSGEHAIGECEEELRLWAYVTNITLETHDMQFRDEEEEEAAKAEEEKGEEGLETSKGKVEEEGGSFAALTNWWYASGS